MVFEIKCAWCGLNMGTKNELGSEFAMRLERMGLPLITHSICTCCREKALNRSHNRTRVDNKLLNSPWKK